MADVANLASRLARGGAMEVGEGARRQCDNGGHHCHGEKALN